MQLKKTITDWFNIANIRIEASQAKEPEIVSQEFFSNIKKQIATLRKLENPEACHSIPPPVVTIESSCDDEKTQSVGKDKVATLSSCDLKPLYSAISNVGIQSVKNCFVEVVKVLEILTTQTIQTSDSLPVSFNMNNFDDFQSIRSIPEDDPTFEKDNVTYIEGILPISTRRYRIALRKKNTGKNNDQPSASVILNNFIRYAFPKHWIVGVTLRGSAGNTSLISIWNFQDPLKNPCEGVFSNGLGECRLRALIGELNLLTKIFC